MSIDPRLKELQDQLSPTAREIVTEVLSQEKKHVFQSLNSQLDRELAEAIATRVKKLVPTSQTGDE